MSKKSKLEKIANQITMIKVSHDEINKYSDVIKLFYANLIGCLDKYFI